MSEIRHWIAGKNKHIVFLGVLMVYLFSANPIYVHFFMQNGKPAAANPAVPHETGSVAFALNTLQPVRVNGQNLYELRGYAFEKSAPEQQNKITIILTDKAQKNAARKFAFSTSPVQYPNMIESYKGYTPAMNGAEFSMLVSNDGLAPGTYQVGILLTPLHPANGVMKQAFVQTGATIKKTYNTIQYTAPAH